VGRDVPIVQVGSAAGSTIGQWLGVGERRLRSLVGCGAAAGIASTFNAPAAGALFSVEIILGDFGVTQFSPIVISSVAATVVSRHFLGDFPAFVVLALLVVLALVKILAVSLTVGSGGSGGIFAPSLFIGAMLGGAVGTVVHATWPGAMALLAPFLATTAGCQLRSKSRRRRTALQLSPPRTSVVTTSIPLSVAHRATRNHRMAAFGQPRDEQVHLPLLPQPAPVYVLPPCWHRAICPNQRHRFGGEWGVDRTVCVG